MRRFLLLVLLSAGLTIPAACGDDDPTPFAFPTVSSAEVGVEPAVISGTAPPEDTMVKVLHEGTGPAVAAGDVLVTEIKSQVWSTKGEERPPYVNTFPRGVLIAPVNRVVPAWEKAMPGMQVGSRVLLVAPPEDGFGQTGNPGAGVRPDDSLIFVVDIVARFSAESMASGKTVRTQSNKNLPRVGPGKDPTITVPKVSPPDALVEQLLINGAGSKVAAGQNIVAQYTGVIWRHGREFDTSWAEGRGPFATRIAETDPVTGEAGVIKGWVQALVGERVGSRILLVIPPNLGYGKEGNPKAGILATDTLVFVVDILGTYGESIDPSTS